MATDIERQIADYFGWIERQTGATLSAHAAVTEDEAETIAALERQLNTQSASPGHRRRRMLALVAAGAVIVIGAAAVLLAWRDDDAGLIIDKPPVTSQSPTTVATVPPTVPSTVPPASTSTTTPITLAPQFSSPVVSFDVDASPGPVGPNTGDSAVFTATGDTIIVRTNGVSTLDTTARSLGRTVSGGISALQLASDAGDLAYSNGSLYDLATGTHLRGLPNARGDLRGDFNPDGTRIIVPAYARRGEATATVYDTATGDAIMDLTTDEVAITWAEYSPDGSLIMTLGRQGVVRIWDASTGAQLGELDESSSLNTFSRDGSAVLSVGASGRVRLRDAVSGGPLGFDQTFPPGGNPHASISPDGAWIVVTIVDAADTTHDQMTVWDAATGVQVTSLVTRAHTIAVRNLAWSADGRVLATVVPDGEGVAIWSIPTGAKLATLALDDRQLLSVDIDAGATRVVGLDSAAQIRVWELR